MGDGTPRRGVALGTIVALQMADALGRVGPPTWTAEPSMATVATIQRHVVRPRASAAAVPAAPHTGVASPPLRG
eukprot:7303656-Prymnesium_polylepis.1